MELNLPFFKPLFYFVFEGNFQVQAPRGGLYLEGRFNGGFFALPVWGAYIWRGLFSEFYGNSFATCRYTFAYSDYISTSNFYFTYEYVFFLQTATRIRTVNVVCGIATPQQRDEED